MHRRGGPTCRASMGASTGRSVGWARAWVLRRAVTVCAVVALAAAASCAGEDDSAASVVEVSATSTEQAAAPTSMVEVSAPTATEDIAARIVADMDRYLPAFDRYEQVRAVLVFHDGEPVLERYLGGAGPEDYWDVRSVTKSVVSALIGIAVDQGYIDGVDQTLGDLLADYGDVMTPEVAAITLRQVLTHTAGFSESWEDVHWSGVLGFRRLDPGDPRRPGCSGTWRGVVRLLRRRGAPAQRRPHGGDRPTCVGVRPHVLVRPPWNPQRARFGVRVRDR